MSHIEVERSTRMKTVGSCGVKLTSSAWQASPPVVETALPMVTFGLVVTAFTAGLVVTAFVAGLVVLAPAPPLPDGVASREGASVLELQAVATRVTPAASKVGKVRMLRTRMAFVLVSSVARASRLSGRQCQL